jgi:hypothetical protein
MMSREQALAEFVAYRNQYLSGDERGEAQLFLDHLFRAFGYPDGLKEAHGSTEKRIRFTLDEHSPTKFADLVIPGRVLIEMKKRGTDLSKTQLQALDYWKYLTPHPRYIITCNFDEFWVYDMEKQVDYPMGKVRLDDLPGNWGPLAFLYSEDEKPTFQREFNLVELTQDAAVKLGGVFRLLTRENRGIPHEHAQQFILQCMVALFAQDIDLLPRYTFTRLLEQGQADLGRTPELFTSLFFAMNTDGPKGGLYGNIAYFNGGLFDFRRIHMLLLNPEEMRLLREAADYNWANIRPAIFGTIFEESLKDEARHAAGIHFTSERDILRIVEPVIVRPWRERIGVANTADDLRALHADLCAYRVLDPACGSGNFLYVAYREMKRLEKLILDRLAALGEPIWTAPEAPKAEAPAPASKWITPREYVGPARPSAPTQPVYPPLRLVKPTQFYGFDTNPFAVDLAQVTLMIAKKLAIDELDLPENALPLDKLDANIACEDALFAEWPTFDACIGNPPYLGAKRMKQEMPAATINQVRDAFPDVPGNADYCVYWFNKAHQRMQPGARAGLVGTNTIRQNYSREGGLDIIVANGGRIFEAVSSMPWSGDAAVHVSIACWEKTLAPHPPAHLSRSQPSPYDGEGGGNPHPLAPSLRSGEEESETFTLTARREGMARLWVEDGTKALEVPFINSSLSAEVDVSGAAVLACNREPKRVFQGQTPGHKGFVLSPSEAADLIRKDQMSREVIFAYISGDDLLGKPGGRPERYIIDFGTQDIIDAQAYKGAFQRIKTTVLPDIEAKAQAEKKRNEQLLIDNSISAVNRDHQMALEKWWQHFRSRVERRDAVKNVKRYVVCSRISKRSIFDFLSVEFVPSDKIQIFAFDDDYSFGILQSILHWEWWLARGATLKSDPAYTPNTIFDTFPWPQQPTAAQVKAVAEAGRALHEWRRERMAKNPRLTLRDLYRTLEGPGANPLRDLHAALDAAVLAAYGFTSPPRSLESFAALSTRGEGGNPHPPATSPLRKEGEQEESGGDVLGQLLGLNQAVAAGLAAGEAVTGPGVPAGYPNPAELVSEGCITPREMV